MVSNTFLPCVHNSLLHCCAAAASPSPSRCRTWERRLGTPGAGLPHRLSYLFPAETDATRAEVDEA